MPRRTTTRRAGMRGMVAARSNAGGATRGQARASQVRAINDLRKSPTTLSPGRRVALNKFSSSVGQPSPTGGASLTKSATRRRIPRNPT